MVKKLIFLEMFKYFLIIICSVIYSCASKQDQYYGNYKTPYQYQNQYAPIQQFLPQGQYVTPVIKETIKAPQKKQVQFSETNNHEKQEKIQVENSLLKPQSDSDTVIFLKNKIEELSLKYEHLESEMKELKNLNKPSTEESTQIQNINEIK